jgi:F0F1-type ATP synthase membrane subunit b/b'
MLIAGADLLPCSIHSLPKKSLKTLGNQLFVRLMIVIIIFLSFLVYFVIQLVTTVNNQRLCRIEKQVFESQKGDKMAYF